MTIAPRVAPRPSRAACALVALSLFASHGHALAQASSASAPAASASAPAPAVPAPAAPSTSAPAAPAAPSPTASPAPQRAAPPRPSRPPPREARGALVVSPSGPTDASWELARAVYANAQLRPTALDDATARVLAGERPAQGAPLRLSDLADLLPRLASDDAAARRLLSSIGAEQGVASIIVVTQRPGARPEARVFDVARGSFEALSLAPDDGPEPRWQGALAVLLATRPTTVASEPTGKPSETERPGSKRFYESGWFWGALAAAAAIGLGAYLITRDSGSQSTVPLEGRIAR